VDDLNESLADDEGRLHVGTAGGRPVAEGEIEQAAAALAARLGRDRTGPAR